MKNDKPKETKCQIRFICGECWGKDKCALNYGKRYECKDADSDEIDLHCESSIAQVQALHKMLKKLTGKEVRLVDKNELNEIEYLKEYIKRTEAIWIGTFKDFQNTDEDIKERQEKLKKGTIEFLKNKGEKS